MRNNGPVTQREHPLADDVILMSVTDDQGRIRYANVQFIAVRGFDKDELIGEPHSVVRHPDMPAEAFADMWATLRAGLSLTVVVTNGRKNGGHYCVPAPVVWTRFLQFRRPALSAVPDGLRGPTLRDVTPGPISFTTPIPSWCRAQL